MNQMIRFNLIPTDPINLGVELTCEDISSFTDSKCFDQQIIPLMRITDQREHIWIGL